VEESLEDQSIADAAFISESQQFDRLLIPPKSDKAKGKK